MAYSENINEEYLAKLKQIRLPVKQFPENKSLIMHKYGNGRKAPATFNFQVYKKKDGSIKLIATDKRILEDLLENV